MALDISEFVRISASKRAGAVASIETFGRTLVIGVSAVLSAGGSGKVRRYTRLTDVQTDFASTTQEYQAAQAYFGQNPRPRDLLIARWANANVDTVVTGGTPTAANAVAVAAISDGSVTIGGVEVSGIDFSGDSSYADVAATLQAALQAETDARFSGATVAFTGGVFVVTFTSRGDLGGAFTAGTTGTNVASLLGLTADEGATYLGGSDAETIADCVGAVDRVNPNWYFCLLVRDYHGTQTMQDMAAAIEARRKLYCAGSSEAAAIVANDATAQASMLAGRNYARTNLNWSREAGNLPARIAGFMSGIDYRIPGSYRTHKFARLAGEPSSDLTTTQKGELRRKRINFVDGIYCDGVQLLEGLFQDEQYWLDWLTVRVESAMWLLLQSSVPQTTAGVASVRDTLVQVLEGAVASGGIARGTVSPDMARDIRNTIGDPAFDGVLSRGYLIWIGSIAAQPAADRLNRIGPPVKIWLRGAGAIHSIAIDLTL